MSRNLLEEMSNYYVAKKEQVHAFVLYKDNAVLRPSVGPLLQVKGIDPQPRPGKGIFCLKCGMFTEVRRWKQMRARQCRKRHKSPERKPGSEDAADDHGWQTVNQSLDFLTRIQVGGRKLTCPQKKLVARLCDQTKVCLTSTRVNEEQPPGLGSGGRAFTIATLNVGALRGKVSEACQVADHLLPTGDYGSTPACAICGRGGRP